MLCVLLEGIYVAIQGYRTIKPSATAAARRYNNKLILFSFESIILYINKQHQQRVLFFYFIFINQTDFLSASSVVYRRGKRHSFVH
jgi:hypothetical protein